MEWVVCFCHETATTEIYPTDTLVPYTTLVRSPPGRTACRRARWRNAGNTTKNRRKCRACRSRAMPRRRTTDSLYASMSDAGRADCRGPRNRHPRARSEEHTSELQSLMRISYAVFCLKKKHKNTKRCNIK